MQRTIKLFRSDRGWMAIDSDPRAAALFGTDTIPTAFGCEASADTVQCAIAALNPDASVTVLKSPDSH